MGNTNGMLFGGDVYRNIKWLIKEARCQRQLSEPIVFLPISLEEVGPEANIISSVVSQVNLIPTVDYNTNTIPIFLISDTVFDYVLSLKDPFKGPTKIGENNPIEINHIIVLSKSLKGDLPLYGLSSIVNHKVYLTIDGEDTEDFIDLSPYLDNTDKYPTDISLNNETGLVTITFNDNSTITEDFSALLGGGESTQIVDTVEDLKTIENPTNGQRVQTKCYGDAGYPLFRELEYNRYDSDFQNPFEVYDTVGDMPQTLNVYFINKENDRAYIWNGTSHALVEILDLADYDALNIGSLPTGAPTIFDKLLIDGSSAVYYADTVRGSYIQIVGTTATSTLTFPRKGFYLGKYYLNTDQTLYVWDDENSIYNSVESPIYAYGNNYNIKDLVKYTVNGNEVIFEILHNHLSGETLEPNQNNFGKLNVWEVTEEATTNDAWSADTYYPKDVIVSESGSNYKAKQSHFSRPSLTPEILIEKYKELLKKGYGSATYVFDNTPITTLSVGNVAEGLERTTNRNNGVRDGYLFTPISQTLPTHTGFGTNLMAENGQIIGLRLGIQATDKNNIASVPKGITNLHADGLLNARLYFRNKYESDFDHGNRAGRIGFIPINSELFLAEDDGTIIRPNYPSFNGKGVWKLVLKENEKLTPSHFGGRPDSPYNFVDVLGRINYQDDERPFDSRQAIQKAMDNLYYPYHTPVGEHYISEEVYGRRLKPYTATGEEVAKKFRNLNTTRSNTISSSGTLWSDRDINYVVFRDVDPLPKSNFNINAQFVEYTTGAAIVSDGRYRQRFEEISLERKGNYETLLGKADNGIRGVVLLPRTDLRQFTESAYGGSFGVNYDSRYIISGDFAYSNFERGKAIEGSQQYPTNGADITIRNSDWTKTSVLFDRTYGQCNIYQNTMQTRRLNTLTQRETLPTFKLNGNVFLNSFPMDFNDGVLPTIKYYKNLYETDSATFFAETLVNDVTDLKDNYFINEEYETTIGNDTYRAFNAYYPKYFVEPIGDDVVFGWMTLRELIRRKVIFKNYQKLKQYKWNNEGQLIIPKNSAPNLKQGIRDSAKENQLLFRNRIGRDAYYFNAYSIADREILKTLEEKSEGAVGVSTNENITINSPTGYNELTTNPTRIEFETGSDLDNDYVEIYFENLSSTFSPATKLFIDIFNLGDFYPKALQLIVLNSSDNTTLYNETLPLNKIKGNKWFEFEKIPFVTTARTYIIRFIGLETNFDEVIIEDIVGNVGEVIDDGVTNGSYYINDIMSFGSNRSNYLTIGGGQTVEGNIDFNYENSPVWKDVNGDSYKIAVNSSGKFVKLFKFGAWEEVEGNVPEIIDTDTITNPADTELVSDRFIGGFGRLENLIGDKIPDPDIPSNMFSAIYRGNSTADTNYQITQDSRFNVSNGRHVLLSLAFDSVRGLVMFFSTNSKENSVGFVKLLGSGNFEIDYIWDTGNLLPETVDKFIQANDKDFDGALTAGVGNVVASLDMNTYSTLIVDYTIKKGTAIRHGTYKAIHDGSSTLLKHLTPELELGTLTDITTEDFVVNGTTIELQINPSTAGWEVKTLTKKL